MNSRVIKLRFLQFLLAFMLALGGGLASSLAWSEVAKIDINSADEATLSTLDGIGPAKAKAIIEYRNKNGKFKSIEEFEKVPGIGPATLKQNAARLTVK